MALLIPSILRGTWKTAAALVAAVVVSFQPAEGQLLTQDEALELAFPEADEILRETAFLTEAELTRWRELAGGAVEPPPGIVTHYVAVRDGRRVGVAYFDAHRVRTLDEVLMVVVGDADRIRRIETVSFREPPEYQAPEGWLDLFLGRPLDEELSLKGEIPVMTGATLTAQAVTDAARRVLALHRIIGPLQGSAETR